MQEDDCTSKVGELCNFEGKQLYMLFLAHNYNILIYKRNNSRTKLD